MVLKIGFRFLVIFVFVAFVGCASDRTDNSAAANGATSGNSGNVQQNGIVSTESQGNNQAGEQARQINKGQRTNQAKNLNGNIKSRANNVQNGQNATPQKPNKSSFNAGKAFKLGQAYAKRYCACASKANSAATKKACGETIEKNIENMKTSMDKRIVDACIKAYEGGKKNCGSLGEEFSF